MTTKGRIPNRSRNQYIGKPREFCVYNDELRADNFQEIWLILDNNVGI